MNINWITLNEQLKQWLQEDIGRGDQTTLGVISQVPTQERQGKGYWLAKASGVICGLRIAQQVFKVLSDLDSNASQIEFIPCVAEGTWVRADTTIAQMQGCLANLLMGERVALNLVMHLSGVATTTRQYVDEIADLPALVVDTQKTKPEFRL